MPESDADKGTYMPVLISSSQGVDTNGKIERRIGHQRINIASRVQAEVHRSQVVGALMILVGAAVLILLASFVVSLIVTILELFVVIIGVFLVLGGIAMLLFGRRFWSRGPWGWETPPTGT